MNVQDVLTKMRSVFGGFSPPASSGDIAELQRSIGNLPEEVLSIYRDHDGSQRIPKSEEGSLAARLMPIAEVIKKREEMAGIEGQLPKIGDVSWLWTDDNSNYCGIYTDGPMRGWLCIFDHEEPMLTPAFRSTMSFLSSLLAEALRKDIRGIACDIPYLPREIPQTIADPANLDVDRQLVLAFRKCFAAELNEDMQRLFAMCAICMTPVEDTPDVMTFLSEEDMWIPESAIRLMELRRWLGGVEQVEQLAREGYPNGDSAAMRLLVRMNTNESREAIARLGRTVTGQKLKMLEMWSHRRLQPPRW
jgi:hypothetical protein